MGSTRRPGIQQNTAFILSQYAEHGRPVGDQRGEDFMASIVFFKNPS